MKAGSFVRWDYWTSSDPWLRVLLALVSVSVGVVGNNYVVVPWAAGVLALDLSAGYLAHRGRTSSRTRDASPSVTAQLMVAGGASVAGIAAGLDVPASRPMLPLLILPALRAGEIIGARAVAGVVVWSGSLAGLTAWSVHRPISVEMVSGTVLWLGLALAIGIVGMWVGESRVVPDDEDDVKVRTTHEAAALLRRLDAIAGSMEAGFDAPAAAELMLDALARDVTSRRSGLLVGYGADPAVPLALRGAERVPWPDPTSEDSPLSEVWRTGTSQIVAWHDGTSDRHLLVVVLHDADDDRMGVLVADREAQLPFDEHHLELAKEVARLHSGTIDVALSFAALRERAGMEERERLAREMHDGIAQELVALGYRVDMAKRSFAKAMPDADNPMGDVREDLTRVLADLRSRIADLRLAVRPDRGLGAIIGDRLQRAGSQSNFAVTLRLEENGFRLPAHVETLIYRLFLRVLADARHSPDASAFNVSLTVSAPQAFLRISHDGTTELREDSFADHPLTQMGAEIIVDRGPDVGLIVQLLLNRTRRPMNRPFITERMPHRS